MMRHATKAMLMAVTLSGLAGSAPVAAQGVVQADNESSALARATELQQQAEALFSQPRQWRRAVRMLEESAELRTESDPARYTCLLYAGRIRAALGDFERATRNLENAAVHALGRGMVVDAAQAYIDAAYAAADARRTHDAHAFLGRAELLAQSPLLTADQRAGIMQRLRA